MFSEVTLSSTFPLFQFNTLSQRESKALNPLVVIFPKNRVPKPPPCDYFDTKAIVIQATLDDDSAHIFIRSSVVDYVMKSCRMLSKHFFLISSRLSFSVTDKILLDVMGAVINLFGLTNNLEFPYQPLPRRKQEAIYEPAN